MIIADNGATDNIIGRGLRGVIRDRRPAPTIRILTASGESESNEIGTVDTELGEFRGYIVEESPYNLWSINKMCLGGGFGKGAFEQTCDSARLVREGESDFYFHKYGSLWGIAVKGVAGVVTD